MSNFDGRAPSYVPGKVPLNQEPLYTAVGKKLLEKVYEVHRARVINAEAMVDDRLRVFDFLTDQSWKMLSKRHQELELMKHNEIIYGRISKVENQESTYTKERREHVKNIEHQSKHSKRLKEVGRVRAVLKIQRENEHMHSRIQKAKPYYSRERMRREYQHHELFKNAKRADHTAGHLLRIQQKLAPKGIPRGEPESAISIAIKEMRQRADSHAKPSRTSLSASGSILTPLPSLAKSVDTNQDFHFKPSASLSSLDQVKTNAKKLKKKKSRAAMAAEIVRQKSAGSQGYNYDDDFYDIDEFNKGKVDNFGDGRRDSMSSYGSQGSASQEAQLQMIHEQLFAIPFDTKNCTIQVLFNKRNTEKLTIKVLTVDTPPEVLSTRHLTLDDAHGFLEGGSLLGKQPVAKTSNEEAHALRTMLINMFREADREQKGSINYDDFLFLMEKNDLGITNQELKFVISEADENDDGFIAYGDFVPHAVDMIQAFRSRTFAKHGSDNSDGIEDSVLKVLSGEELEGIATICLDKIKEKDFDQIGALPPNALKRALEDVMGCGLSAAEVALIVKQLPRDHNGRCLTASFKSVLYEVRFLSIKNTITEAQGTDIGRYLADLCCAEEKRIREDNPKIAMPEGSLTLRSVIDIMLGSPRLSLSRLQVMVIVSEAQVVDGFLDWLAFSGMAARAIHQMYDPEHLKQRAQLIEQSEMGGGTSLVHGLEPEVFQRRLLNLFKSYDTDRSGSLDLDEFRACLDGMDLHLTPAEVLALMTAADTDGSGHVDMDEFTEFCTHNLMHLEREKHIRSLQLHMKKQTKAIADKSGEEQERRLRDLFALADEDESGYLSLDELAQVFNSLDLALTEFQLQVLLSEADGNGDGKIAYNEFLPIAMDLLQVLKINDEAVEKKNENEKEAMIKAEQLTHGMQEEIGEACRFIRSHLKVVSDTIIDAEARAVAVKEILHAAEAQLGRSEIPYVLRSVMPHRPASSESTDRGYKSGSVVIDYNDLEHAYFEARKMTVMFGLLENKNKGTLETHILNELTKEAEKIKEENGLVDVPVYIPVHSCFQVLEQSTSLRFHRAQLVAIISWADCFDEDGSEVDFRRFAKYASEMMSSMLSETEIKKRNKIKSEGNITDDNAMRGLSEADLVKFLGDQAELYHKATHGHGHAKASEGIFPKALQQILQQIPKLSLSAREASTIVGQMPIYQKQIHWNDFVPHAYHTIASVCKERMISRRIELAKSDSTSKPSSPNGRETEIDMAQYSAMKRLAMRLLQIVRLKSSNDRTGMVVSVYFSAEAQKPVEEEETVVGDAVLNTTIGMSGAHSELLRTCTFLTIKEKNLRTQVYRESKKIPVMVLVIENDMFTFPNRAPLVMTAMSVDGSFHITTDVPVRLPTVGLVDPEVATAMAQNVVANSFIEKSGRGSDSSYKLSFSDLVD